MHFTAQGDSLDGGLIVDMAEWPPGLLWIGAGNGLHRIVLADLPEKKNWWHRSGQEFGTFLPKFGSLTPTQEGLWFRLNHARNAGAFFYDGATFS